MEKSNGKLAIVTVTVLITGLLFVALSVPLIKERVEPNGLYGFRVEKTLSDEGIWYSANKQAGWYLLGAGIVVTLGTCVLWVCRSSFNNQDNIIYWQITITLISVTIFVILSFIYLNRL